MNIQPGLEVENGAEVNINIEPSPSGSVLYVQMSAGTGARLAVTVDVPTGMDNPNDTVSASLSTTSTINVEDGVRFGSVGGSNNAGAVGDPVDAPTVNTGRTP